MSDIIYQQIQQAIQSGKMIQAIKLLRQVENIDLSVAKERVQAMALAIRNDPENNPYVKAKRQAEMSHSSTPKAHSHTPARSGGYNVESDLPTEAFLFFQRGEVSKGIKVVQDVKGVNKATAKRLAKMFFERHPEYTSSEIISLMSSSVSANASSSNSNNSTSTAKRTKKKSKTGFFEAIIFFIIFVNNIKACTS